MSLKKLELENRDGIAFIGFGKNEEKSMNTLTEAVMLELGDIIMDIEKDSSVKGVVFHSLKPGCFLAGVDITLIDSLNTEAEATIACERGQHLFDRIEDLKIPTMALVNGICLGGGLELSLACDRIAISDNPKVALGLPEVMLGVLPGFGGTYRLPKKIGLPNSLDMILSGKQIRGRKNLKWGIAEFMLPSERMLELAPEYLFKKIDDNKSFKDSLEDMAVDNFISRKVIFQKAREKVLETTKGFYPAPLKILDHLESNYGKNRKTFLSKEAQAFGELCQTTQSENLRHIFFLTDNSKKMDYIGDMKKVNRGAVLGAGTMGGGIAWLFAHNNQAPIMKDIGVAGLELGLKQSSMVFKKAVKRRRMSQDDFERKQRSITPTTSYDVFNNVDLVIEAVVENMDIKKSVFSELEKNVSRDCLITSNTSSLRVTEMAEALEHKDRFAGLHFFNPVHMMPLVEIITHPDVSEETVQSLYKWCLKVKKTPIVVGDGPGFLVNRILMPFISEAVWLLEEGVSIEEIDKAVLNFGMPMGACRLMDEIGIDVLVKVSKIMYDGLGERAKASDLSLKATESDMYGKKNKKGFYLYDEKGKQGEINPEMLKLLPKNQKHMDETEIQLRVFLPMINEAANIIQDGIVDKASTVDLGLIYGIGFPPFKGGLLKYADSEGLDKIGDQINKFCESVDKDRYALSPKLKELIEQKKKFYDI